MNEKTTPRTEAEERDFQALKGGRLDQFLDRSRKTNESHAIAIVSLMREATPEQLGRLRKLLHRQPPWKDG
jgi:hypothetical protein